MNGEFPLPLAPSLSVPLPLSVSPVSLPLRRRLAHFPAISNITASGLRFPHPRRRLDQLREYRRLARNSSRSSASSIFGGQPSERLLLLFLGQGWMNWNLLKSRWTERMSIHTNVVIPRTRRRYYSSGMRARIGIVLAVSSAVIVGISYIFMPGARRKAVSPPDWSA